MKSGTHYAMRFLGGRSGVRRLAWLAVVLATVSLHSAAEQSTGELDPLDPLLQPAAISTRAATSVLLAITRAGNRLVAAGEGGIIIRSDDNGKSWVQAKVPVSVTVTALSFPNPEHGWAVGHSGVILATSDGGASWTKQIDGMEVARLADADAAAVKPAASDDGAMPPPVLGPGDPFLDVDFSDDFNGFAVGAFGLILRTRDGGKTWALWRSHVPNADGNHLYAIRRIGTVLYMAGERGNVYLSKDNGDTFSAATLPYGGSLFGIAGVGPGGLVVFGLQGHVFRSNDQGRTWFQMNTAIHNAWTGAVRLSDGQVLLGDQAGDLAVVGDSQKSLVPLSGKFPPMSAAAAAAGANVVIVGPAGASVVRLPTIVNGAAS
jgi:photosystem II stability/assembly factor-like uncharacterized protein